MNAVFLSGGGARGAYEVGVLKTLLAEGPPIQLIGGASMEPGKVTRTDRHTVGFKIGELDSSDSARAREIAGILGDIEKTEVTTNLAGERWSKLMINCMSNGIAGLTGYTSAQVRTVTEARRVGIQPLFSRQPERRRSRDRKLETG